MEKFILNGSEYKVTELLFQELDKKQFSTFEYQTLKNIKEWVSGMNEFTFQTSGSTGEPKKVNFFREQIQKSAQRTIDIFHLEPEQTVLCCLDTNFVAGYMMLIRAIEGDLILNIQEPSSDPLNSIGQLPIDFVAMTPNQLKVSLDKNPDKIKQVRKILVGGAGIHPELENQLFKIDSEVFHGYAMTETLTHVAIRNISEGQQQYKALAGVTFDQDNDGCLVVNDSWLNIPRLKTNDLVELIDELTFVWYGRKDNVINTGGIKIHLEQLERSIASILFNLGIDAVFCLVAHNDVSLSDRLVLLIENNGTVMSTDKILKEMKSRLPKYHDPKEIILVSKLLQTKSGKIDRIVNAKVYLAKQNSRHE